MVVKGTFTIPAKPGGTSTLADIQEPVRTADEYPNSDPTMPVTYETEVVPFKDRTDLVLLGHCYAPKGTPKKVVDVLFRVGRHGKILRVFGDRTWFFPSRAALVPVVSDPEPFQTMPITYDRAFGGIDQKSGKWSPFNLAGKGFIGKKSKAAVHHLPLPNIEDPRNLVSSWHDQPPPSGFGYYDRGAKPRIDFYGVPTGKEDDPIGLPEGFNPRFYSGAHPDLQANGYLNGSERVELRNLTPERRNEFDLPGITPRILVERYRLTPDNPAENTTKPVSETRPAVVVLDTVIMRPDDGVYELIWRAPLEITSLDEINIKSVSISL